MNHHKLEINISDQQKSIFLSDSMSVPSSPSPLTTGTTVSSTNTLPSTPGCNLSGSDYFSLQKLDDALHRKIVFPTFEQTPAIKATTITEKSGNPYAKWKCGFDFTGRLSEPTPVPDKKANFVQAVNDEINIVCGIKAGLTSYVEALRSGTFHEFEQAFLHTEVNAAHTTIAQLEEITTNLQTVTEQVKITIGSTDLDTVEVRHQEAFGYAKPWIIRARAILISSHVFYKINYVLGGSKKISSH